MASVAVRSIVVFHLIPRFEHIYFRCSKTHLIETVILSTHKNICCLRNKKTIFNFTLLSLGIHVHVLKDDWFLC